jgi:hypothetical protein
MFNPENFHGRKVCCITSDLRENKVHNSSALIGKGKNGNAVHVLNYVIKHYPKKAYRGVEV